MEKIDTGIFRGLIMEELKFCFAEREILEIVVNKVAELCTKRVEKDSNMKKKKNELKKYVFSGFHDFCSERERVIKVKEDKLQKLKSLLQLKMRENVSLKKKKLFLEEELEEKRVFISTIEKGKENEVEKNGIDEVLRDVGKYFNMDLTKQVKKKEEKLEESKIERRKERSEELVENEKKDLIIKKLKNEIKKVKKSLEDSKLLNKVLKDKVKKLKKRMDSQPIPEKCKSKRLSSIEVLKGMEKKLMERHKTKTELAKKFSKEKKEEREKFLEKVKNQQRKFDEKIEKQQRKFDEKIEKQQRKFEKKIEKLIQKNEKQQQFNEKQQRKFEKKIEELIQKNEKQQQFNEQFLMQQMRRILETDEGDHFKKNVKLEREKRRNEFKFQLGEVAFQFCKIVQTKYNKNFGTSEVFNGKMLENLKILGKKGDPTTSDILDVIRLMKDCRKELAHPKLKLDTFTKLDDNLKKYLDWDETHIEEYGKTLKKICKFVGLSFWPKLMAKIQEESEKRGKI